MGSPGSIEKVMVTGILFIIVGILGVAIWGSRNGSASASGGTSSLTPPDAKNAAPPLRGGGPIGKTGDDVEGVERPAVEGDNGFVAAVDSNLENSNKVQPVENGKFDEVTQNRKSPEAEPDVKSSEAPNNEPVVEPSKEVETPDTYTIQSGDNFSVIAAKVFGDKKYASEIQKANPGVQPTKLFVNQKIKLPKLSVSSDGKSPPVAKQPDTQVTENPSAKTNEKPAPKTHTIQAGDNLVKISKKYYGNVSKVKDIEKLNKDIIKNPNDLPIGKTIKLP